MNLLLQHFSLSIFQMFKILDTAATTDNTTCLVKTAVGTKTGATKTKPPSKPPTSAPPPSTKPPPPATTKPPSSPPATKPPSSPPSAPPPSKPSSTPPSSVSSKKDSAPPPTTATSPTADTTRPAGGAGASSKFCFTTEGGMSKNRPGEATYLVMKDQQNGMGPASCVSWAGRSKKGSLSKIEDLTAGSGGINAQGNPAGASFTRDITSPETKELITKYNVPFEMQVITATYRLENKYIPGMPGQGPIPLEHAASIFLPSNGQITNAQEVMPAGGQVMMAPSMAPPPPSVVMSPSMPPPTFSSLSRPSVTGPQTSPSMMGGGQPGSPGVPSGVNPPPMNRDEGTYRVFFDKAMAMFCLKGRRSEGESAAANDETSAAQEEGETTVEYMPVPAESQQEEQQQGGSYPAPTRMYLAPQQRYCQHTAESPCPGCPACEWHLEHQDSNSQLM